LISLAVNGRKAAQIDRASCLANSRYWHWQSSDVAITFTEVNHNLDKGVTFAEPMSR
jgi:hypothetical protein